MANTPPSSDLSTQILLSPFSPLPHPQSARFPRSPLHRPAPRDSNHRLEREARRADAPSLRPLSLLLRGLQADGQRPAPPGLRGELPLPQRGLAGGAGRTALQSAEVPMEDSSCGLDCFLTCRSLSGAASWDRRGSGGVFFVSDALRAADKRCSEEPEAGVRGVVVSGSRGFDALRAGKRRVRRGQSAAVSDPPSESGDHSDWSVRLFDPLLHASISHRAALPSRSLLLAGRRLEGQSRARHPVALIARSGSPGALHSQPQRRSTPTPPQHQPAGSPNAPSDQQRSFRVQSGLREELDARQSAVPGVSASRGVVFVLRGGGKHGAVHSGALQ